MRLSVNQNNGNTRLYGKKYQKIEFFFKIFDPESSKPLDTRMQLYFGTRACRLMRMQQYFGI